MTSVFHNLPMRISKALLAICLCLCLILSPFGQTAEASRSLISGKYEDDTIFVIHKLQEVIEIPNDAEGHSQIESEAIDLITDYMSVYRNRQGSTSLNSFTTMQTALNSLAGHYKNYSNRPLSEQLKERLNKELTKAERSVQRGS